LKIDGRNQYLCWAVDQDGEVIDILGQSHRDFRAAERFLKKILRVEGTLLRRVFTDRLCSYGVAMKELMPSVEYPKDKGANNRAKTKPIQVRWIRAKVSFQFFNDQQPLQKLPSYTERIESPVGADEALCRMESDVRGRDMRIVGDRAYTRLGKVKLPMPCWS
jgi:transposase-like protein